MHPPVRRTVCITRANRSCRSRRVTSREVEQASRLAITLPPSAAAAQSTISPPQKRMPPSAPAGTASSKITESIHGKRSSATVPKNLMSSPTLIMPRRGRR